MRRMPQGYANAAELVAGLKKVAPFEISVAAYPEVHPDSDCPDSDLDNLIAKIDAGADRAISQFFFSADNFFRFRDRVAARGVDIEIVPGILPVSNVAQTRKFAGQCGAAIPDWMDRLFEGLDDLPAARQLVAATDRQRIVRPALCRRGAPVPFLHAQSRRACLCHLPFARSSRMTDRQTIFAPPPRQRVLIKDGAYGTQIQAEKLVEADYRGELALNHDQKGNNDLLNLTRPEIVAGIARRFVAAGADILATNSFNATRISQADYGCEHLVGDINRAAARIIREVVDEATAADGKPRWVAGAVGPTNKTLSLSPDVNDPGFREVDFDEVKAVYREQIDALVEGGVDAILIETVFDTLNCKSAIMAALEAEQALGRELPIMISMTLTDLSGRNLSGHTVEAFWASVRHARPLTIGLNCSFGAAQLRPHLAALSATAETLVMAYPNAGLPNELGEYDEAAEQTAAPGRRMVRRWPGQHRRRLLRHHARPYRRHRRRRGGRQSARHSHRAHAHGPRGPGTDDPRRMSNLDGVNAARFVNIGERTNVTGSAKFKKLILAGDYDAAVAVALDQVENGAQIIDVNMDEALLDGELAMATFLKRLAAEPDIARVPVMIDSARSGA